MSLMMFWVKIEVSVVKLDAKAVEAIESLGFWGQIYEIELIDGLKMAIKRTKLGCCV